MIFAGVLAVSLGFLPDPLTSYVLEHDSTTRWTQSPAKGVPKSIDLISQTWHGVKWNHDITINQPAKLINKGAAVLVITGDRTGLNDEAFASNLAGIAGMPVATLYQIPNQPIWGQKEDGLIALTLQKWFETKDDSLPLLLPMAKSAYEAMNAIETSTAKTKNPIKKFVVTGASKRGWTTWLVAGTGDKRIIGIAPVVFDNLNIVAQMKHQKALWGHYSPQIQDYEKSGMLAALETPDGKRLATMLDPLTYADRIRCPLFSINGTNDPFWAPNAIANYWDELKMPRSCLYLPNEGHTFKEEAPYLASLGAFAASCAGEFEWPSFNVGRIRWARHHVAPDFRNQLTINFGYSGEIVNISNIRRGKGKTPPIQIVPPILGSSSGGTAIAQGPMFKFESSMWSRYASLGIGSGPNGTERCESTSIVELEGPIGVVLLLPFQTKRHGFWISSRLYIFSSPHPR